MDIVPHLVQRGATLGANCTIICGVTIGEYAFVGAGAVVTRDVEQPMRLMTDVLCKRIGWMCVCGVKNYPRALKLLAVNAAFVLASAGQFLLCPRRPAQQRRDLPHDRFRRSEDPV